MGTDGHPGPSVRQRPDDAGADSFRIGAIVNFSRTDAFAQGDSEALVLHDRPSEKLRTEFPWLEFSVPRQNDVRALKSSSSASHFQIRKGKGAQAALTVV